AGGYELDTRVHRVANGLGISAAMRAQYFRELSGGEKTRINLACAILQDTDVLLLDEPTNHLDIDAVEWLEGYLSRYSGTILIISHDRYFIDRTVTRVIELEDGETNFYAGNYSFYMEEKQARYLEQKKRYEAEQKKIAELSFAAERLHGWGMGNKRLQVRAFAMERRIERMRKTEKPRGNKKNLRAQFSSRDFGGDEVMLLHDVSKNFGERKLLQNISLKVENGDRIALIGKNGSGKTTLLNIIMGREEHEGAVRFGAAIKVGLLPQVVTFDNEKRNLVDTVIYALNATPQTARNHLAAFDFTGEDVFETVDTLSGGERTRLALCILMARKINFLILDEPTNHLDIASREWIEEAVHSFEGTLLFVSHDRYFLDRFTNRVWSLDDAAIEDYLGGFTQYRNMVAAREAQKPVIRPASAQKSVKKKQVRRRDGERKIAECERDIAKLEDVISGITDEIELCSSDYERLEELYQKQHDTQEELDTMYLKWEALNEE
ncbi:MAG: ABC-F family ATP-binding cassette domain-containing protein, partial [Clostridia bacterium]